MAALRAMAKNEMDEALRHIEEVESASKEVLQLLDELGRALQGPGPAGTAPMPLAIRTITATGWQGCGGQL